MFNTAMKQAVNHMVVIHTQAITVRGTLRAVSAGMMQIRDAECISDNMGSTRIDGYILIDQSKADYIQVVGS
jgi:small nuclear ribonucleoprotein (snRNP)-like protein